MKIVKALFNKFYNFFVSNLKYSDFIAKGFSEDSNVYPNRGYKFQSILHWTLCCKKLITNHNFSTLTENSVCLCESRSVISGAMKIIISQRFSLKLIGPPKNVKFTKEMLLWTKHSMGYIAMISPLWKIDSHILVCIQNV